MYSGFFAYYKLGIAFQFIKMNIPTNIPASIVDKRLYWYYFCIIITLN